MTNGTTLESVTEVDSQSPSTFLIRNGSDEIPPSTIFAENVTSRATEDADVRGELWIFPMVQKVLECGFVPAVSFIGAPVNVLNMIIFYRQGLRDKMNLCLFSLALVDFLYVTSMCVLASYCFVGLAEPSVQLFAKWWIRKYDINFVFAFWYSSGALSSIIALERCICVVFPLKSGTMLNTRTMGVLLFSTVLAISLLCLIYAFKHSVGYVIDPVTGKTVFTLMLTDLYLRNRKPFDVIENVVLPSVGFVTFIVVAISTIVTAITLRRAIVWRQKKSSNSVGDKRQVVLVKMLVTVSCIYILCTAPMVSLAILRFRMSQFSTNGKLRHWFYVTHRAGNIILMINSSVNFFVYVKQSSRFRQELRKMTRCANHDGPRSAMQSSLCTGMPVKNSEAHVQTETNPSKQSRTSL